MLLDNFTALSAILFCNSAFHIADRDPDGARMAFRIISMRLLSVYDYGICMLRYLHNLCARLDTIHGFGDAISFSAKLYVYT